MTIPILIPKNNIKYFISLVSHYFTLKVLDIPLLVSNRIGGFSKDFFQGSKVCVYFSNSSINIKHLSCKFFLILGIFIEDDLNIFI